MVFEDVKKAFIDATAKLKEVAVVLEKAIGGYQDLPYSQRKDLKEVMKDCGEAVWLVGKAIGFKWWKKCWPLKALGIFLLMALFIGVCSIFFPGF